MIYYHSPLYNAVCFSGSICICHFIVMFGVCYNHPASAEEALRKSQAPEETTSKARSKIIGVLKKVKPPKPNLSVPETKALRELRNNDSIMMLPTDNGRATVVMNKTDYDTKVKTMLADASTYKPLPKDPTPSLQRQMNALLLSLR